MPSRTSDGFKAKDAKHKMWNNASLTQQTKEYYVDTLIETSHYFSVFRARDAIERVTCISQNIKSITSVDTGSNYYLLASEAVERAISLKKVLDEYNDSLLVPICFSWIVVAPCGCDDKIWNGVHEKPQGNCGILIHPEIEWSRDLEGFTFSRLESGVLCLEQRFFSVEKISEEVTIITEPIVLTLIFESKEARDNFRIPAQAMSFSNLENELELYCERLDCSLIKRAISEGAIEYSVCRKQEVTLFHREMTARRIGRFDGNTARSNTIPKCCLPYCDLLEEQPSTTSP